MKWFRRRSTVADLMADITREAVETAKLDVDIQHYVDLIQKEAQSGERYVKLDIRGYDGLSYAKKKMVAASLKRLGFSVRWDSSTTLDVRW